MTKWTGKTTFSKRPKAKITFFCLFFLLLSTQLFAATFYISPKGSDSNNGATISAPIATFSHAYTIMSSGDTLMLMDGTYQQQLFPPATLSGSSGAPTTFEAVNTDKAIIAPTESDLDSDYDSRSSLYIYSNTSRGRMSYFDFTGLFVKGVGEHNAIGIYSMDDADPDTEMTHHINLRKCGSQGSAVDDNVSATEIMGSTDILFEDGYSFGFGRKAMEVYGARNVTVRRVVVRFDWWEGDNYKPNDPRVNLTCYNTIDSVFENILSFDAGPHPSSTNPDRTGLVASGNDAGGTGIQGSDNSGYYGCIVFNNLVPSGYHTGVEIDGGSGSPATDITFQDIVVWDHDGYGVNIQSNVDGVVFKNITVANTEALSGVRIGQSPTYPIKNVHISYSLSRDNGDDGFYYGSETTLFSNNTAVRNANTDIEASYEPTIKWLPAHAAVTGHDRGADVTKRYVNKVKTNTDLWPWVNEANIKNRMCNPIFISEVQTKINGYEGDSDITFSPKWCSSGKTLTKYVWEYLGNDCPDDVCTESPNITPPYIKYIKTTVPE